MYESQSVAKELINQIKQQQNKTYILNLSSRQGLM